jgi:hypothetical protein
MDVGLFGMTSSLGTKEISGIGMKLSIWQVGMVLRYKG